MGNMDSTKIFVNDDKNSYLNFIKSKEEKKSTELRINSLELQIRDLQTRIAALENNSNRG
jgi:chaperonin cofactor prefoldin